MCSFVCHYLYNTASFKYFIFPSNFQEEELGRPIYNNQILGRRNFNNQDNLEDMAEVERQILEGAEAVGEEKRLMIMEQLHNDH